jgi:hypothetical protein
MAYVKKQPLGILRGTIASVVFKKRGNKFYIASKPGSFIPGVDSASVFRRNQGAFVGKLSKHIYSVGIIKELWKKEAENKSYIYQKIWSENYKAADCNNLDQPVRLGPGAGFIIKKPGITFEESSIHIKTNALGSNSGIKLSANKFILAAGVIILKEPASDRVDYLNFLPFAGEKQLLNIESEINMTINFGGSTQSLYKMYKFRKCHLMFVTLDENGKPIDHSETIISI